MSHRIFVAPAWCQRHNWSRTSQKRRSPKAGALLGLESRLEGAVLWSRANRKVGRVFRVFRVFRHHNAWAVRVAMSLGCDCDACRLLSIHRLQCRERRRCVTELGGDFCRKLRHQRFKYPAASCVRWRCNGVFSRKISAYLAPAVRKAVACSWDASRALLRLVLAAKDSSAVHCVCQCRKSVFQNMKRFSSIRLNCFRASKVDKKSRVSNFEKLG